MDSKFILYRSSNIPCDIWKKISEYYDKNSPNLYYVKNNSDCKKSRFEITSIENNAHAAPGEHCKSFYMQNLKEFEAGKWKGTDYIIPPHGSSDELMNQDVEILDDISSVVWVFTHNHPPPDQVPQAHIEKPTQARFVVTTTKSLSSGVSGQDEKTRSENSINDRSQPISDSQAPSIFHPPIKLPNIFMEDSAYSKEITPTAGVYSNDVRTSHDELLDNLIENLKPTLTIVKSDTINKSMPDPLNELSSTNEVFRPKCAENSINSPPRDRQISSNVENLNFHNMPMTYSNCTDVYHRSMEKMTRASFTSLSTLSSHLSAMSDHVLELNNLISDLKCENERLRHENLILASRNSRNQGRYSFNIVHGEDNSINIVFDVIPGKARCVNIGKFLSPEEYNYLKHN